MDPLILALIIVVALAAVSFFVNIKIIKMLQDGSQADRKVLLSNLQENTRSVNERLDAANRMMSQVQRSVGEVGEIGRSMKDLQQFLNSPKLRGNIGEQVLKELLTQMLPKQSFHLQYTFKTGDKVDAAITTSAGLVPIDSKFPMENFRKMGDAENFERKVFEKGFERDVKSHIDAISKKYILPSEGTIDYALMYIPSEAVYYEVVNNSGLYDYSAEKRVLPVSPTTFYAFLKAILMSFEGQKIEKQAQEIMTAIRAIQKDYVKVEENLGVLQKHLNNAYNTLGTVFTTFNQLGQKVNSTKLLEKENS